MDRMKGKRRFLASGLVALDIVEDKTQDHIYLASGGTSGNVAAILSIVGWNTAVLSRLDRDAAGSAVLADLKRWGVDTKLATLQPVTATPIIIQRIRFDSAGVPYHSFSFSCPGCGSRLPRYQPLTIAATHLALTRIKQAPDVVFIDRVSPANVLLARECKKRGSLIYFEPTSMGEERHFEVLTQTADVIKYSVDRIDEIDHRRRDVDPCLEIQTLGRGGLRYRCDSRGASRWEHLDAPAIVKFHDAAGAGDWLSAYLIDQVVARRTKDRGWMARDLARSLSSAQAIAAWSCQFAGARGAMYEVSQEQIRRLFRENTVEGSFDYQQHRANDHENVIAAEMCLACSGAQRKKVS